MDGARLRQQLRRTPDEPLLPPLGLLRRTHQYCRSQSARRPFKRPTQLRHSSWRAAEKTALQKPKENNALHRATRYRIALQRSRHPGDTTAGRIKPQRPHRDRSPTRLTLRRSQANRIQLPGCRPSPHRALPRSRNHLRCRATPQQNHHTRSNPPRHRRLLRPRRTPEQPHSAIPNS